MAALLQGSENVIQNPKDELTPAEQRALEAMDLEEVHKFKTFIMYIPVLYAQYQLIVLYIFVGLTVCFLLCLSVRKLSITL